MTIEPSNTLPTLLIAEDEIVLRMLAVEMLRDAGLVVLEAGNGVEALAMLQANPQIGLLISDIKMPQMNGYELAELGLTLMPGLKVLLLTGYSENPSPEKLRQADIRILHKPFDLEQLCAVAQDMLGVAH